MGRVLIDDMMERNKVMRRLAFWTSGGILIVLGLYFYLKNPLYVSFNNLILVVVIWPIIFAIVDFLFRKNKVYGTIMLIIKPLILIAFYLILSIYECILSK